MSENLTQELSAIANTYPGKVGLYLHDLKTNQKVTLNADDRFFMASTYKVPMLMQLYRDHDAGLLSIHDKITLTPEIITSGYGLLKSFSLGTTLSLKDIALLMITISDNIATQIILDIVTPKRINETLQKLGIESMQVDRSPRELLADLEKNRSVFYLDQQDSTTPRAMGQLMEKLIKCELASEKSCHEIQAILNQQILNWRMARKMMPLKEMKIAHKTGTTNRIVNDVGFIQISNRPEMILCIFTYKEDESIPQYVAEEMIGDLTKKVIEAIA